MIYALKNEEMMQGGLKDKKINISLKVKKKTLLVHLKI